MTRNKVMFMGGREGGREAGREAGRQAGHLLCENNVQLIQSSLFLRLLQTELEIYSSQCLHRSVRPLRPGFTSMLLGGGRGYLRVGDTAATMLPITLLPAVSDR